MEVIILDKAIDVARFSALRICELMTEKPATVLGLATGSTQVELYRELAHLHREAGVSFRRVTTFNLDEYVGIDVRSPQSYRSFMHREFFSAVDIDENNTFLPTSTPGTSPGKIGSAYEDTIRWAGGIDLQILGIGRNGHIGFNEPTSSLASRTRIKTLTRSTIEANSHQFGKGEFQPTMAMTMGIGTILESRRVLLLATGAQKSDAVRDAVEGPLSSMCPASALQLHPCATVVLDRAAASGLSETEYYEWVYQQKCSLASESAEIADTQ